MGWGASWGGKVRMGGVGASSKSGRYCFMSRTGANRSPRSSIRSRTSQGSKYSAPGSSRLRNSSSSSHDSGVDTNGRSLARRE